MFKLLFFKTPLEKLEQKIRVEANKAFNKTLNKCAAFDGYDPMTKILFMGSYNSFISHFQSNQLFEIQKKTYNLPSGFKITEYKKFVQSVVKKELDKFIEIPGEEATQHLCNNRNEH